MLYRRNACAISLINDLKKNFMESVSSNFLKFNLEFVLFKSEKAHCLICYLSFKCNFIYDINEPKTEIEY